MPRSYQVKPGIPRGRRATKPNAVRPLVDSDMQSQLAATPGTNRLGRTQPTLVEGDSERYAIWFLRAEGALQVLPAAQRRGGQFRRRGIGTLSAALPNRVKRVRLEQSLSRPWRSQRCLRF